MNKIYQQFLDSPQWSKLRQECFRVFGDQCPCGSFVSIQPHHLFYPKYIWDTKVEHLIPLCWKCHKALHCSKIKPFVYREEFVPAARNEVVARVLRLTNHETFYESAADNKRMEEMKRLRAAFKPSTIPTKSDLFERQKDRIRKRENELRKQKIEKDRKEAKSKNQEFRAEINAISKSTDLKSYTAFPI